MKSTWPQALKALVTASAFSSGSLTFSPSFCLSQGFRLPGAPAPEAAAERSLALAVECPVPVVVLFQQNWKLREGRAVVPLSVAL